MSRSSQVTTGKEEQLDKVFRALSHRVRRELLAQLSQGERMITELAKPFKMSFPAVSKHLGVLQDAGLIAIEVDGRVHRCSLNASALKDVEQWLEYYRAFWNENLDSLARYLENDDQSEHSTSSPKKP